MCKTDDVQLGRTQYCPDCDYTNPSGYKLPDDCIWCNAKNSNQKPLIPEIDWGRRFQYLDKNGILRKIGKDEYLDENKTVRKINEEDKMEKTIKLCDSCGRSDNIETYLVGSYDEFDGHRNEEEYVYVDLCCYCFDLLNKVKYLFNTSQAKMFNVEKEEIVKLLMFFIKKQRIQLK